MSLTKDLNNIQEKFIPLLFKGLRSEKSGILLPLVDLNWKQTEKFIFYCFKEFYPKTKYYGNRSFSFDFIHKNNGINVKTIGKNTTAIKIQQMKKYAVDIAKQETKEEKISFVLDVWNNRLKNEKKDFAIDNHYNFIIHTKNEKTYFSIFELNEIDKDKIKNIVGEKETIRFEYENMKFQFSTGDSTLSIIYKTLNMQHFCIIDVINKKIIETNQLKNNEIILKKNNSNVIFNPKKTFIIEEGCKHCLYHRVNNNIVILKTSQLKKTKRNSEWIDTLIKENVLNSNGVFVNDYVCNNYEFKRLFELKNKIEY